MKNLFYKEMKLAMHPVIWVFIFLFPFMVLIPSYPMFIGFIYICSAYPILFLGANKGQQSNDIYYTCLLPIKKSDAIKARILTVGFLHLISLTLFLALSPLAIYLRDSINQDAIAAGEETLTDVGLSMNGFLSGAGFAIFGFIFYDLVYFLCFYKNGRSVVLPTLVGMLVFSIIEVTLTTVLPLSIPAFNDFFSGSWIVQGATFGIALLLYVASRFLIHHLAAKRFEQVDL